MKQIECILNNHSGLHARPAAQFVQKAASFTSKVTITAKNKTVDAKSILGVMGMGLAKGAQFTVTADGADETECLAGLQALVESNFGEA
ncbi:MAG TPA: HPr family phosphocarrier protein [Patescibacteria group bacterium]|nr:HPr family phosphocarrier protein [Patescibacteria group bacterium]